MLQMKAKNTKATKKSLTKDDAEKTTLEQSKLEGGQDEVINDEELEVREGEGEDERYPKSNRILTAIVLSIMGLGIYIFDKLLMMFDGALSAPYNYVFEFYNLTLLMPAQTFPKVWAWLNTLSLTSNPDVNLGIVSTAMFLYWLVVLGVYALWVEFVGIIIARLGRYDRPDIWGAFQAYLMPALIALLFFLLVNIFLLYGDNSTFDY